MPVSGAAHTNPARRNSDTRFGIVMVRRSIAPANAMAAGKISNRG
jgi:hypothetical protein